jgi:hypothetical protein
MMRGLILVVAVVVAGQAHADGMADAKKHFDEGSKWYDLGDFPKAIVEYKAAYAAYPEPVFLYNIAQAARLNNDLSTALFFYRSFLRKVPGTPNRREIENRIHKLEAQIEQQKALVTTPPNTTVPPGALPGAETSEPPGARTAEPAGASTSPATGATGAAEKSASPVSPTPMTSPATTTSSPPPEGTPVSITNAPRGKRPLYKRWELWTAVGVTAAVAVGLGVGLGIGLSASAPSTHFATMRVGF